MPTQDFVAGGATFVGPRNAVEREVGSAVGAPCRTGRGSRLSVRRTVPTTAGEGGMRMAERRRGWADEAAMRNLWFHGKHLWRVVIWGQPGRNHHLWAPVLVRSGRGATEWPELHALRMDRISRQWAALRGIPRLVPVCTATSKVEGPRTSGRRPASLSPHALPRRLALRVHTGTREEEVELVPLDVRVHAREDDPETLGAGVVVESDDFVGTGRVVLC